MNNNRNIVLNACIKKAQKGETDVSVFDLMYETSLEYTDLKPELDRLVSEKELEAIDIKTYKFIGEINRKERETPADGTAGPRRNFAFSPDMLADVEKAYKQADDYVLRRSALKVCIERNAVSAALLERALSIGYVRASKLINWMESMGYVSPVSPSTPRKVLITPAEFEAIYGEDDGGNESDDDEDFDKLFESLLKDDDDEDDGENG